MRAGSAPSSCDSSALKKSCRSSDTSKLLCVIACTIKSRLEDLNRRLLVDDGSVLLAADIRVEQTTVCVDGCQSFIDEYDIRHHADVRAWSSISDSSLLRNDFAHRCAFLALLPAEPSICSGNPMAMAVTGVPSSALSSIRFSTSSKALNSRRIRECCPRGMRRNARGWRQQPPPERSRDQVLARFPASGAHRLLRQGFQRGIDLRGIGTATPAKSGLPPPPPPSILEAPRTRSPAFTPPCGLLHWWPRQS